jgi:phosphoglycolate phosphatase
MSERAEKKQKIIVFDWNGTLLDDLEQSLAGFNAVLRMMGAPEFSVDEYQQRYTVPFIKLYESGGVDADELRAREVEVHQVFHATYDQAALSAQLRQGAQELLDFLRQNRIRILVLSNHTVHDIRFQAARLGIEPFFDAVLANDVNGVAYITRGKDQRLKDYMQQHAIEGGIIVGDTVEEVEIGQDIGLISVALTGGMCSEQRLREIGPDHLIDSLAQLPPILEARGYAQ